ncbi:MAG: hypothetical protein RLZZ604_139 [Pseudomonadota bacterium]
MSALRPGPVDISVGCVLPKRTLCSEVSQKRSEPQDRLAVSMTPLFSVQHSLAATATSLFTWCHVKGVDMPSRKGTY